MIGKLLGKVVAEIITAPVTVPAEAIKASEKLLKKAGL